MMKMYCQRVLEVGLNAKVCLSDEASDLRIVWVEDLDVDGVSALEKEK